MGRYVHIHIGKQNVLNYACMFKGNYTCMTLTRPLNVCAITIIKFGQLQLVSLYYNFLSKINQGAHYKCEVNQCYFLILEVCMRPLV